MNKKGVKFICTCSWATWKLLWRIAVIWQALDFSQKSQQGMKELRKTWKCRCIAMNIRIYTKWDWIHTNPKRYRARCNKEGEKYVYRSSPFSLSLVEFQSHVNLKSFFISFTTYAWELNTHKKTESFFSHFSSSSTMPEIKIKSL